MVDLDCPWCEGSLALDDDIGAVTCETCGVRAELAPDPLVEQDLAA
jgi:hypothetical protein